MCARSHRSPSFRIWPGPQALRPPHHHPAAASAEQWLGGSGQDPKPSRPPHDRKSPHAQASNRPPPGFYVYGLGTLPQCLITPPIPAPPESPEQGETELAGRLGTGHEARRKPSVSPTTPAVVPSSLRPPRPSRSPSPLLLRCHSFLTQRSSEV